MAAKVESTSAYKGIGLVKLMGRQSGFITMQASMASGMEATWVQLLHPYQTLGGHVKLLRASRFAAVIHTTQYIPSLDVSLINVGVSKLHGRRGMLAPDAHALQRCRLWGNCKGRFSAGCVDVCLIPEVPFALKGSKGLFAYVEKVLEERGHCVMCIAEGAGQVTVPSMLSGVYSLPSQPACTVCAAARTRRACMSQQIFDQSAVVDMVCGIDEGMRTSAGWSVLQDILAAGEHDRDPSGNPILKDVGPWMRGELKSHFKDADIKYIDPSYMIRSTPTISADRIYCKVCSCSCNPPCSMAHHSSNISPGCQASWTGDLLAGCTEAAVYADPGA